MDGVHTLVPFGEQELLDFGIGQAALSMQESRLPELDGTRQLHLNDMLPALVTKDPHLYTHSCHVQLLTHRLAQVLHLSPYEATLIELAALIHDIGKLVIPAAVLQKASRLTHEEFTHIKQHPVCGAVILTQMGIPYQVRCIVYHHHEHWDGGGYPAGLQGEAIPLGARLVAIADAFEVMTSHRPYQAPRTSTQALEELRRCAGSQFDPILVDRFCTSLETGFFGTSPFETGKGTGVNDDGMLAVVTRKAMSQGTLVKAHTTL
jgi:putative nucleotidyltransferase with HDIG domain